MAILVDDPYLESLIISEQLKRGDRTKTRTAVALLTEHLAKLGTKPLSSKADRVPEPKSH